MHTLALAWLAAAALALPDARGLRPIPRYRWLALAGFSARSRPTPCAVTTRCSSSCDSVAGRTMLAEALTDDAVFIDAIGWEKAAPQTLDISLTFGVPDEAARDDDIAKTIDYAVVITRIRAELSERHFNLLETLGEYVIGLMLDEFRAPWVKISIAKVGIAKGVKRVGVQIERSRSQS